MNFPPPAEIPARWFPEEALQHLAHVADNFLQIEHLGLHDILAAEHEQLARETRGAFGGEIDGLNRVNHRRRQRRLGEQRTGMPLNDREHVVEVMRDTGGKLAMDSIFCAWRNCASKLSRSVMSST